MADAYNTEKKPGFFGRLFAGLRKSRNSLQENLDEAFGCDTIDDEFYECLEEALVASDMGIETTETIIENLKDLIDDMEITKPSDCKRYMCDCIKQQMRTGETDYAFEQKKSVVLVIGVNGVGKTTTVGKLAAKMRSQGKKVVIAAADTFRAAALEQLTVWADRAGVDLISGQEGADPSSVVFDAIQAARSRNADMLLIDTAGRLHNKKNLMNELGKIDKILAGEYGDARRENLIVLDATTGQNALEQARQFKEVMKVDGIILTKMDGTAKGGIAVAISKEMGVPVLYMGYGEKAEDLRKFNVDEYVEGLFAEE